MFIFDQNEMQNFCNEPSKHLSCTLSQYLTHNFQHLSYGLPTHFLLSVALALNGNQFVLCKGNNSNNENAKSV